MSDTDTPLTIISTWEQAEDRFLQMLEFHQAIIEVVEDCLAAVANKDRDALYRAVQRYKSCKPPKKFRLAISGSKKTPATGGGFMN